jgi:propanol-preferring alcohol dehydrogenase
MACSGLTAYSALKKVGDTLSKAPVVVIGAGGLGLMSIGLIKALGGLAPIVVDIDSAKRDAAIKAGASVVIDGASPNAAAEIMAATGKAPVAVIDFVGAETTTKLGFDVLGKTGRLVIVGLYGGASPWQLPFIPMKSATIMGSYIGSLPEFHELMGLVLDGSVEPLPTMRYKLDEANGVLDRLEHGQVIGRAILMP